MGRHCNTTDLSVTTYYNYRAALYRVTEHGTFIAWKVCIRRDIP
jgi:hypothetical protein